MPTEHTHFFVIQVKENNQCEKNTSMSNYQKQKPSTMNVNICNNEMRWKQKTILEQDCILKNCQKNYHIQKVQKIHTV